MAVRFAYIDSSCLVAIALAEPGAKKVAAAGKRFGQLLSSNLLEAEVRAALAREGLSVPPGLFRGIAWVHPNRSLAPEFERALVKGPLRGADLWHVACALFLDPAARELTFLSLDRRQQQVAAALGFETL